jgi:hypothetical protein
MFISVLSAVPVRESSRSQIKQENSRLAQVLTEAGQRSIDSRFHNAYNASLDLDQAEYVWIFFLLCQPLTSSSPVMQLLIQLQEVDEHLSYEGVGL